MSEKTDTEALSEQRGIRHVLLGITVVTGFLLVFSALVQLLWNWLMPEIFGLKPVTYLQALGLLVLTRLLFGRVGQRRDHAGYLTGKYGFRGIFGREGSRESR